MSRHAPARKGSSKRNTRRTETRACRVPRTWGAPAFKTVWCRTPIPSRKRTISASLATRKPWRARSLCELCSSRRRVAQVAAAAQCAWPRPVGASRRCATLGLQHRLSPLDERMGQSSRRTDWEQLGFASGQSRRGRSSERSEPFDSIQYLVGAYSSERLSLGDNTILILGSEF